MRKITNHIHADDGFVCTQTVSGSLSLILPPERKFTHTIECLHLCGICYATSAAFNFSFFFLFCRLFHILRLPFFFSIDVTVPKKWIAYACTHIGFVFSHCYRTISAVMRKKEREQIESMREKKLVWIPALAHVCRNLCVRYNCYDWSACIYPIINAVKKYKQYHWVLISR